MNMSNIESIEILVIVIILLVQAMLFVNTSLRIQIFAQIFKGQKFEFSVENSRILVNDGSNKQSVTILEAINSYFSFNKNVNISFDTIKDVVERNTDALEQEITVSLATPLYLGLMGTLLGIVLGLFNMSGLTDGLDSPDAVKNLGTGISVLLGGVKIAMIASFFGLLLTVVNTNGFPFGGFGWHGYKQARLKLEADKNRLYTVIQTAVLPQLNQNMHGSLELVTKNLFEFNDDFSYNINELKELFSESQKALIAQGELLRAIQNADIGKVASFNLDVLKKLDVTLKKFDVFNSYLERVNNSVYSTEILVEKLNEFIERTNSLGSVVSRIHSDLDRNGQLLTFLSSHLSSMEKFEQNLEATHQLLEETTVEQGEKLEEVVQEIVREIGNRKQSIQSAMADMDLALANGMEAFQDQMKRRFKDLDEFSVNIQEQFRLEAQHSKDSFQNLRHLEKLNEVSQYLNELRTKTPIQSESLLKQINDLNDRMDNSVEVLSDIRGNSPVHFLKTLVRRLSDKN